MIKDSQGPETIAIIGSTGSIGTQALDVIKENPEKFRVHALTAGTNVEKLIKQCREFLPKIAVIAEKDKYEILKNGLKDLPIIVGCGQDDICNAVQDEAVSMVLSSSVGYSGLIPTLAAIKAKKDIALANKETLVVAGEIVIAKCKENNVRLYPVDSEHSAIYQCLSGEDSKWVNRLILTASGGPFLRADKSKLNNVSVSDALCHPKWDMGAKISIDSATMMNKAFEIIEARWLFNLPVSRIDVYVHPQSVIHSMVEFVDGSIKAQLGVTDMRIPIKYALCKGERMYTYDKSVHLGLENMSELTFEKPDLNKFPCLALASVATERGGNTACIINAANEVAVDAFLKQKIRFTDIYKIIEKTIAGTPFIENPGIDEYINTNTEARGIASALIKPI